MAETIKLAKLQFDVGDAEKQLKNLQKELDSFKETKFLGREDVLPLLIKDANEQLKQHKAALKEAEKAAKDLAESEKKEIEQLIKLKKAAFDDDKNKAQSLLLQGIGGEELPEKFKKISDGFRIFGDTAHNGSTRAMALVGSLSMLGTAASNILGPLIADVLALASAWNTEQAAAAQLTGGYESVSRATRNQVTAQQALSDQQTLSQHHIRVTGDELAQLERQMVAQSHVTGVQAPQAIGTFAQALESLDNGALAQFGVHLSQTTDRIAATREAMQQMQELNAQAPQQRTGVDSALHSVGNFFGRLAGDQINEDDAALRHYASSLQLARENAEAQTRAEDQLSAATLKLRVEQEELNAHLAANDGIAKEYYGSLQQLVVAAQEAETRFAAGQISQTDYVNAVNAGGRATRELTEQSRQMAQAMDEAARAQGDLSFALRQGEEAGDAELRVLDQVINRVRQGVSDRAQRLRVGSSARRTLLEQGLNAQQVDQQLQGLGFAEAHSGGNQAAEQRRRAIEEYEQAARRALDLGGHLQIIHHQYGETVVRYYNRLRDAARGVADAQENINSKYQMYLQATIAEEQRLQEQRLDHVYKYLEAQRDANEQEYLDAQARQQMIERDDQRRAEIALAEQQRHDASSQFTRAFETEQSQQRTGMEQLADVTRSTTDTLIGASKSHIAAVIEEKESAGDAARSIAHEALLSLATESVGRALFSTAQGFANLGLQNYPGAAASFTAAGIYAAVAAGAGLGAYATNPPKSSTPAGASGGSNAPAKASSGSDSRSNGPNIEMTINYGGLVFGPKEDLADNILSHVNDALARGGYVRNQ